MATSSYNQKRRKQRRVMRDLERRRVKRAWKNGDDPEAPDPKPRFRVRPNFMVGRT